jgi:hypothetical protein
MGVRGIFMTAHNFRAEGRIQMNNNCNIKIFENLKKIMLKLFNINVTTTKGDNSPVINGGNNVYKK